jgi:SAM-dependent methyltransferase
MSVLAADSKGYLLFYLLLGCVALALVLAAVRRALRTSRKAQTLEAAVTALNRELGLMRNRPDESTHGLTVLTNPKAIKDACAALREGASEISGIWCSRYDTAEIVAYFHEEHQALTDNKELRIRRVINPNAVGEAWAEFQDLWSRSKVQDRWDVRINESLADNELMYVRYPASHDVGVLQINELQPPPKAPDAAICFIFDPRADQWLKNGVNFIDRWFTGIFESEASKPLQASHVRTWGPPVPARWDAVLRDDPDLPGHFRAFLKQEQAYLAACIEEQVRRGDRKVSVVEIGCATGRTLLDCIDAFSPESVGYLIGCDSSREMVSAAVTTLRRYQSQSDGDPDRSAALSRVRLCVLDAESLSRHFKDGALVSPPVSALPGVGLHWHPEGGTVESHIYDESRKVFCCLLNTLGDLRDTVRLSTLESMVRALGPEDVLCLSLFAGESFDWAAGEYYSRLREVTRATEEDEKFDAATATMFTTSAPEYWARWMFRTSPSPRVARDVTVEGLLEDLRRRLEGSYVIHWDIVPSPPDPGITLGHFVSIKRIDGDAAA